ncbi:MAG: proton-conducting transporter membrane subunit [Pseudomonadota bacterium]
MIDPGLAIVLCLGVPLLGFAAIWLLGATPNLREAATLVTASTLLLLVLTIFLAVGNGETPGFILLTVIDGLTIEFRVEPLGALFALIASGLWIVNSLYSIGYMRGNNEPHQTRFYMSFAIAIASAMGVAFAANLFTLFIFYEVLTLSTFPLVTHKGNDAARRGGRIYLGILMGTSIGLLLPAIAWVYALTGDVTFREGGILAAKIEEVGPLLPVLLGLFAFGIGKAALMPIHPWLPNAMVAPTPVSAFLHAVAVVKAGVFSILKVVIYIFGIDLVATTGASTPFIWLAAISILLSSMIAMNKDNLKARLAYSTVSQLSYVTLGAMLATQMAVMGGALQIAMHALGKMTLFMCAGAIYTATHKTLISEMRGLGRTMPITFGLFFLGAMSIIGLPPLGGSWPKFFLMVGAVDAGQLAIIFVLMVSSVFNVLYLLSIPVQAFYMADEKLPETDLSAHRVAGGNGAAIAWSRMKEAPLLCLVPPALTAFGALLLFFFGSGLYSYLLPIIGSP